jgi:hypothetical protein
MPLHDCPYSFEEIAQQILPSLMSHLTERMTAPRSGSEVLSTPNCVPDKRGAYVWMIDGKPIYVGIANRLRQRIKGHLCADPSKANLAVRMAAKQLGVPVSKVKNYPDFEKAFSKALTTLAGANLAFIEIDNPLVLYLFEPYCAMQLDTSDFNRFDTLQILSPRYPQRPQDRSLR